MSVQINCCPVKGRDRFRRPHQRAHLASVQVPACTQGGCWPLLTLTLCPDLAWVNAGCPGWGHRRLDKQLCARAGAHALVCAVPGKSQVGAWVWQSFLSSCMSQLTGNGILEPLSRGLEMRWDELFLWVQEVLQFICSSVWSQEETFSGPELLSPLSGGSLCNINMLEKLKFCNKARKT